MQEPFAAGCSSHRNATAWDVAEIADRWVRMGGGGVNGCGMNGGDPLRGEAAVYAAKAIDAAVATRPPGCSGGLLLYPTPAAPPARARFGAEPQGSKET